MLDFFFLQKKANVYIAVLHNLATAPLDAHHPCAGLLFPGVMNKSLIRHDVCAHTILFDNSLVRYVIK